MEDGSGLIEFDVPEFSSTVLSQLNELRLQGKLCDIVVHIQGRPFRAHKAVLAASSPYFRDHSALGTMSGLSLSVIKSPDVFERLLAFCYTGRMALPLKDVVSFLTAASFLQMQAIIDKCTQILEGIHSKISLPPGGSPGGDSPQGNRDGFKDGGAFLNPVQVSPPYFPRQPAALPGAAEARPDPGGKGPPRPRAPEEGQSDRGSSSDGAPEQEAELEQVELIGRDGQVTDVRVKMEKAERPSCSDSSSAGDDGYHTELVDGEQVLAVSVGSYGPMLQPAGYSYPPLSASAFVSLSSASPSRSILSGFRGGRARPKRPAGTSPEAPGRPKPFREDGEAVGAAAVVAAAASPAAGFESDVRERSLRGQWYPYSERLVCIYCGKSFNQKGSLDRHMRLHMGITPFVCKFCGKKYTRKDQLEYHIRGHTDNKPFHCQICGKCFPFQGTLNQHLRKKHMGAVDGGSHADSPERTEAPPAAAAGDAAPPGEEPSGNGEESARGSPEESPHGSRCDF